MLDLSSIASNLQRCPEGFWASRSISAVSYPEGRNNVWFHVEDHSFWFRHRNQCILTVVRRFPPPGTFFDIGGGNGYVAKALQDGGVEVVLVEPGTAGARNAIRRGVTNVVNSTLQDAGFCAGRLGAAGLFDVLEHVEADVTFLADIRRHLVPGGRIYLTVPAFQRLWSKEDVRGGHWRRYTLPHICQVFRESGLEIEYATYFFGFLPLPIFLFRALPFSLGLASKDNVEERANADHRIRNSLVGSIVEGLNRRELRLVAQGRRIGMGASCLVVAKRPAADS